MIRVLAFGVVLSLVSVARADTVVLVAPTGAMSAEDLHDLEDALALAIRKVGHQVVTEAGALQRDQVDPPRSGNELRAVAEMQQATYAVSTEARSQESGIEVVLRVGYAPQTRVEQVSVHLSSDRETVGWERYFRAMLRPEGMGEEPTDAEWEKQPPAVPSGSPESQRDPNGGSAAAEADAPPPRSPRTWIVTGGIGLRPLVAHRRGRDGGVMWALAGGVVRRLDPVPGLELRGSLELIGGATRGFSVAAGAGYLLPLGPTLPIHLGGTADVGVHQFLSGNRVPSLLLRVSPIARWSVDPRWAIEAQLPELQFLSANGGVVSLGLAVRAGYRF